MGFVSMRRNFGHHMRILMYVIFAIFVVGSVFWFGSYTREPTRHEKGEPGGGVIATVDGQKIAWAALDARFQEQYQRYEDMGAASLAITEFIRYQVLNDLIQRQLLIAAAKQQGMEVSSADLKQELDRLVNQALQSRGKRAAQDREYRRLLEDSIRARADDVRDDVLVQRLHDMVVSQVKTNDEAVRESYHQVQARHILIRVDETGKAGLPDAEAKKKAEEILAKLKGGADFAALAKQFSGDQGTAANGGDLGFFKRGDMTPAFDQAAFALKPGQLSGVVKTPSGYHIIKVEKERYDLPADFDQNIAKYRKRYAQEQGERVWADFVRRLREQAKIEIRSPEMRAAQALQEGKTDEAIKGFTQALNSDRLGDQVRAAVYLTLGQLYGQKGDWKKAVEMNERSLDVAVSSLEEIEIALGDAYAKLGNKERALYYYKAAEDEAPDDFQVRSHLVTAYRELGDTTAALRQQAWMDEQQRKWEEERKQQLEEQAREAAAEAQKKAGAPEPSKAESSPLGGK